MAALHTPTAFKLARLLATGFPLIAAACATPPQDPAQRAAFEENNDPLEPMNRAIFDFNDTAYTNVLFPVARGYNAVLPDPARTGIHNALGNLGEPVAFMNKTLQGDFSAAGTTVARFLLNSIFGFGGLIDVASHNDLPEPKATDFGATLHTYGVGEGPYLVVPILGPNDVRDTAGSAVDGEASPWGFVWTYPEQIGVYAVGGIDQESRAMNQYLDAKKSSVDFYAFIRSSWRQNRRYELTGGKETGSDTLYNDPGASSNHP
jgi:phospholipid-binding lipoprotein MlaA